MKRLDLFCVMVAMCFVGLSSVAEAEELVENMPIKSIEKDEATVDTQVNIRTSNVVVKRIPLGHALVLAFPEPFVGAQVANPAIADSLILSPTQLYLAGKGIGYTTLTLWDKKKNLSAVLELVVHLPIDDLKQNLTALFPEEKDIVITTAHEHIILTGQVSNIEIKTKIGQVAGAYAPHKVLNFLKFIHE
ncbi:MAG: pilus assembly protein N-terminal domain-containing protein [Nitrospirales bacterium]|nr:pilus assembly protein N-terminal domain-containing protein [Nitrospira sp.]MDR4500500.1 pilus assembly protein N-terminal domain-containing protein [Nitrospirales bacterium]